MIISTGHNQVKPLTIPNSTVRSMKHRGGGNPTCTDSPTVSTLSVLVVKHDKTILHSKVSLNLGYLFLIWEIRIYIYAEFADMWVLNLLICV